MKVCNYTVGQADSDNTFASMQDNGSHIISFNISLVSPGDRDVKLETVCDEMREDPLIDQIGMQHAPRQPGSGRVGVFC